MTTIASFITVSKKYQKIYLLSDSRVTWPVKGLPKFDNSTKIYPLNNSGDIFAYCGDSLFSLSVLSRIKTQLESYHTFCKSRDFNWKKEIILGFLNESLKSYPTELLNQDVVITHYTAIENHFFGVNYTYDHKAKLSFEAEVIDIPKETKFIKANGSGRADLRFQLDKQIAIYGEQAYSIFFTFHEFIKSGKDPKTGGLSQVVQLDSSGEVKLIGIHDEGELNVLGESNEFWKSEYSIEIRSKYFELSDKDGNRLTNEKDRSYQEYQK